MKDVEFAKKIINCWLCFCVILFVFTVDFFEAVLKRTFKEEKG